MNIFSIKDIERLSGIKAHTLRIWEQRHGLCFCKRKESQHRYYDNEDLKQILRVAFLYHNGYKVSKIAKMSSEDIRKLAGIHSGEKDDDNIINKMVEAGIDYDQERFERIIKNALTQFGFEECIRRIFYPFFDKIGLLWLTDHAIPAHEHFSSHLIQQKIIFAIDALKPVYNNQNKILIFAPKGEHHEIPLLVMQYLFKKHGSKTIYFGCNLSLADVEYYCRYQPVTHVYMHLITNFTNKEPQEYFQSMLQKLPQKKIIVSGPAFSGIHFEHEAFTFLRSCDEMMNFPESMN